MPGCGVLGSTQSLFKGQSVTSCDGRTQFVHQRDGQIALLRDGRQIWRNGVTDPNSNVLTMQQEGHLVQWGRGGRQLWRAPAPASPGAFLIVGDDCNAYLADPHGGGILWSTNSSCW
jgi:hypothetical protein